MFRTFLGTQYHSIKQKSPNHLIRSGKRYIRKRYVKMTYLLGFSEENPISMTWSCIKPLCLFVLPEKKLHIRPWLTQTFTHIKLRLEVFIVLFRELSTPLYAAVQYTFLGQPRGRQRRVLPFSALIACCASRSRPTVRVHVCCKNVQDMWSWVGVAWMRP